MGVRPVILDFTSTHVSSGEKDVLGEAVQHEWVQKVSQASWPVTYGTHLQVRVEGQGVKGVESCHHFSN
jgi:hypothetical protein